VGENAGKKKEMFRPAEKGESGFISNNLRSQNRGLNFMGGGGIGGVLQLLLQTKGERREKDLAIRTIPSCF